MGLFNRLKEPIFLKTDSNVGEQLTKLKALEPLLNSEGQAIIRQDIKCLEYGIIGEENVAFELKNSHMPMYILHDIYLEDGDLSAQIDYLVFTRKICFVIECKNLYGDIEINNVGDFIRTTNFGNKRKKEGIYSPITQNQRHLELMKKIKVDNRSNALSKYILGKMFENYYMPVILLANPKTVLYAKYAKKETKDKVIRADNLVKYIKNKYEQSKENAESDKEMLLWAQSFINLHREVEKDYTEKYKQFRIETAKPEKTQEVVQKREEVKVVSTYATASMEESQLFKELKIYRLNKSREEKIKPYFIYNDNQLKDLISKMPRSKKELQSVSGFGESKANKYGDDILAIMAKF